MSEAKTQSGLQVARQPFGQLPDGSPVEAIVLKNSFGMRVKVLNYGATISECWVPDRNLDLANVVLGFDNISQYLAKHPRFGATIGRYANRIANAQFELDGVVYKLKANKGTTTIHGGEVGFDKRLWNVSDTGRNDTSCWVKLQYLSPHMEEGFPGNLDVQLTFSLCENNSLILRYHATTDKATPINLTNHSYFNLRGAGSGDILEHLASFNADYYTPLNEELVPTGELRLVQNTPYDFRERHRIGDRIQEAGGYDINYAIRMRPGDYEGVGSVLDPVSGRILTVFTGEPAFQFFTANSLDGSIAGIGGSYQKHAGFCIETQHFPDSVHHPNFPSTILRTGGTYGAFTQYAFSNMPEGWKFED